MNKLTVLIGIAGAGKSTYAKYIAEQDDKTIIVSSDAIQEELFGDASCQNEPAKVFDLMYKRTAVALTAGFNVVYDATNIKAVRRAELLSKFDNLAIQKVCIYFNVSLKKAYMQNMTRDRHVPRRVIYSQYKSIEVPTYAEGWDEIQYK